MKALDEHKKNKVRVAVIQMVSGCELESNLQKAEALVSEAAKQGARLIVLPEYFCLMGQDDRAKVAIREPFGEGVIQARLSALSKAHAVYLFAGTIPLSCDEQDRVFNSLLVFSPEGACIARYDKIHLFHFSGVGERYAESDTIAAGRAVKSVETAFGRVGLSICYDLRFPELFRAMEAPEWIVLPAAFTAVTGRAHWRALLQARAIENQCFVLASAQGGVHENGRETFGHSMIIDPWGEILGELETGEGVLVVEVSRSRLTAIRSHLPALSHRVL